MILEILKGFLVGICASIPLGPVAILVIQKTLSKGHKAGFLTGMGACLVDTVFAIIAMFAFTFAQQFLNQHEVLILLVGGLIVAILGWHMATSNPFRRLKASSGSSMSAKDFFQAAVMGFSNPGAILVIFALFAFFNIDTNPKNTLMVWPILMAVALGSAVYWFGVSALINHFRKRFKIDKMLWVNRIAGAIIAVIGIVLLAEGLYRVVFLNASVW